MVLKGKERGGGAQIGPYLLNTEKNEHVDVHEVRGFMSDNVVDALLELDAVAKGTRCKNYMFSVVLSPPENAETKIYEDAIARIEEKMGLEDQPRVVVFHEKDGHRHAHCVWSRIDTQNMKAINLPYYKNRLMEISKELFLDYGWKLPQGFIDKEKRNPLNFTREEWQQAKRLGDDPKVIKAALKECWSISDNKASFQKALEQHGYYLARGDRRGYVAVDWRGKPFSLSRWAGEKPKALEARLGESSQLPSVEEITVKIDNRLVSRLRGVIREIRRDYKNRLAPLLAQKTKLKDRHNNERKALSEKQAESWQQETRDRQTRLNKGFRGLWDRLTGRYVRIIRQNEAEAFESYNRDRAQKDRLIQDQLRERKSLQKGIQHVQHQLETDIKEIKKKLFSALSKDKSLDLLKHFERLSPSQGHNDPQYDTDLDLSM
ncbi:MAG: relaxase/mobilization nuclease domain-containing protein [Candidatus Thiodiazotropha sp.]